MSKLTESLCRPTRRELTRASTIEEIKEHAFRLMKDQGAVGVRFSDIAREMGMSAPALYRYFPSRDDLLTALIVDSYDDLTRTLEAARTGVPDSADAARLEAVCHAYRSWASRERVRFALLFGLPVPDYAAPHDGPTKDAAGRAFDEFQKLVTTAVGAGVRLGAPAQDAPPAMAAYLTATQDDCDPDEMYAVLQGWTILHGFTSLEAFGQLEWVGHDVREAMFDGILTVVAGVVGLQRAAVSAA